MVMDSVGSWSSVGAGVWRMHQYGLGRGGSPTLVLSGQGLEGQKGRDTEQLGAWMNHRQGCGRGGQWCTVWAAGAVDLVGTESGCEMGRA